MLIGYSVLGGSTAFVVWEIAVSSLNVECIDLNHGSLKWAGLNIFTERKTQWQMWLSCKLLSCSFPGWHSCVSDSCNIIQERSDSVCKQISRWWYKKCILTCVSFIEGLQYKGGRHCIGKHVQCLHVCGIACMGSSVSRTQTKALCIKEAEAQLCIWNPLGLHNSHWPSSSKQELKELPARSLPPPLSV